MLIKTIQDENFINYYKPAMFIGTCFCTWKCCIEQGLNSIICQNHSLSQQLNINIEDKEIVDRYLNNKITKAIVFGGLEPLMQFEEMYNLITCFRENTDDDIVIYTGFYEKEIYKEIDKLKQKPNIIMKFGRYIPNQESHYDAVLGIKLASQNQYGKRIS